MSTSGFPTALQPVTVDGVAIPEGQKSPMFLIELAAQPVRKHNNTLRVRRHLPHRLPRA
jgi:hypothetical protein